MNSYTQKIPFGGLYIPVSVSIGDIAAVLPNSQSSPKLASATRNLNLGFRVPKDFRGPSSVSGFSCTFTHKKDNVQ